MASPVQKAALLQIQRSGSLEGIQDRTLEALHRKGHLKRDAEGRLVVTGRGLAWLEGRMGGNLPAVKKAHLRAHLRDKKPAKRKAAPGAARAARKAHEADQRKTWEKAEKARGKVLGRILGPSGVAHAVKISKATGEPFRAADVEAFRKAGWEVLAAGSVAGRVGSGGIPGIITREDDWTFHNPDTLGPSGLARAIVLGGRITRAEVDDLAAAGFDVASAPKKLREAHRNPSAGPKDGKKIYSELVKAAKKRQALNASELAARTDMTPERAQKALEALERIGLAHVAGRDLFGECWTAGAQEIGLFSNPGEGKVAKKKAAAWYQRPDLVTEPRKVKLPGTVEAVEIGRIVAIEYESDKYDGKLRVWRHEVTKPRALHISADGKVMVVLPGFKVTKRGIEG